MCNKIGVRNKVQQATTSKSLSSLGARSVSPNGRIRLIVRTSRCRYCEKGGVPPGVLSGRGFACGRSVDPWMDNRGTGPGDCSGLGGLYFSATGCDCSWTCPNPSTGIASSSPGVGLYFEYSNPEALECLRDVTAVLTYWPYRRRFGRP